TLTSAAIFGSNPLTNIWFRGTTNGAFAAGAGGVGANRDNGTTTAAVVTNTFAATNATATLTVNNIQTGTNYIATWSDVAGSVQGYLSIVEVIQNPVSKTVNQGATTNFTVTPTGNSPPSSFQWKTNGVNLANNTKYAGVTTATLFVTNAQPSDALTYTCPVVNPGGTVNPSATLA